MSIKRGRIKYTMKRVPSETYPDTAVTKEHVNAPLWTVLQNIVLNGRETHQNKTKQRERMHLVHCPLRKKKGRDDMNIFFHGCLMYLWEDKQDTDDTGYLCRGEQGSGDSGAREGLRVCFPLFDFTLWKHIALGNE